MPNTTYNIWLLNGYKEFAIHGKSALNIEQLARIVGKSKSSFYHHFADIRLFEEQLLGMHIQRAHDMARDAAQCKTIDPDLISLFLMYQDDLFFNKQLRFHRELPHYEACFLKANALVEPAFMGILTESLGLSHTPHITRPILNLVVENFYLKITYPTFSTLWLKQYIQELMGFVKQVRNS